LNGADATESGTSVILFLGFQITFRECRMHQQVYAEEQIRQPNQKFPNHAASPMHVKGED
jgi:hypothetical protein